MNVQDITALNTLIFFVFTMGVITGAICTGFLNFLKRLIESNVQHPKRVSTFDGYLYRYQGKYIPLSIKERLIDEHRAKVLSSLKPHEKKRLRQVFYLFVITIVVLFIFLLSDPFSKMF